MKRCGREERRNGRGNMKGEKINDCVRGRRKGRRKNGMWERKRKLLWEK